MPAERALSFASDGQVRFDMERYIAERKALEAAAQTGTGAAGDGGVGGDGAVEQVTAAMAGAAIEG